MLIRMSVTLHLQSDLVLQAEPKQLPRQVVEGLSPTAAVHDAQQVLGINLEHNQLPDTHMCQGL
jgi:hypothetical protein